MIRKVGKSGNSKVITLPKELQDAEYVEWEQVEDYWIVRKVK